MNKLPPIKGTWENDSAYIEIKKIGKTFFFNIHTPSYLTKVQKYIHENKSTPDKMGYKLNKIIYFKNLSFWLLKIIMYDVQIRAG